MGSKGTRQKNKLIDRQTFLAKYHFRYAIKCGQSQSMGRFQQINLVSDFESALAYKKFCIRNFRWVQKFDLGSVFSLKKESRCAKGRECKSGTKLKLSLLDVGNFRES